MNDIIFARRITTFLENYSFPSRLELPKFEYTRIIARTHVRTAIILTEEHNTYRYSCIV